MKGEFWFKVAAVCIDEVLASLHVAPSAVLTATASASAFPRALKMAERWTHFFVASSAKAVD